MAVAAKQCIMKLSTLNLKSPLGACFFVPKVLILHQYIWSCLPLRIVKETYEILHEYLNHMRVEALYAQDDQASLKKTYYVIVDMSV